jgi:mono/diheme cytochrome c family protein
VNPIQRLLQALGLVVLAVGALLAVLAIHGYGLANGQEDRPLLALRVRPDPALRERGRHLAELACAGCHGANDSLPLAGGAANFLHEPGSPALGMLAAPNLTPGGALDRYSDAELGRAIREGLDARRRPMLVMPSNDFRPLSDRDLAALIAYLRSQPAVARATPPRRLSLPAYLLLGMQAIETSLQRPVVQPVAAVPEGPTPVYGEYLTGVLGCADCHGTDFRGGRNPLAPRGPDLQPSLASPTPERFERALREGVASGDRRLDPALMPWTVYRRLSDTEVAAIHQYLRRQSGVLRPGR